jgi:hypothetical protein
MSKTAFALRLWTRSCFSLTQVRPCQDDHHSPTSSNLIHIIQLSTIPYLKRPFPALRHSRTSKRRLTTLSSSKPVFQPPKIQTALLPSQDGSKGVVEYALYPPPPLKSCAKLTALSRTSMDALSAWARNGSLHYLTFGLACCGIEMMHMSMVLPLSPSAYSPLFPSFLTNNRHATTSIA